MKTPTSVILLMAGFAFSACAADTPDLIQNGNDAFYNLDYDRAIADYQQASNADPSNPALHNYVAQALLYREMLRNGALESQLVSGNNSFLRRPEMETPPEIDRLFFAEISRSMQLSKASIAKNARDTNALKALGVAFGLKANYGFLVKKSWRASLSDAGQARKYDALAMQIDPNDYDARLLPGCYDYIVGSLSWGMRTLGFMAGFHGDKQRGIRTIEEVAQHGAANRDDANIILCALYRREGQTARAIPLDLRLIERYPRNYLLRFELAQMYAAIGDRQNALDTLDRVARLKRDSAPGYARVSWEKIYYEAGNLLFWFNDLDHALEILRKVTLNPEAMKELDPNTGVLAWMREGQIYDMQNRHRLAIEAYRQAIEFAPRAEAAHESQRYIDSPYSRQTRG